MPGLVGIITKMPRQKAERELQTMVAAMRHDASYVAGTWCDERLGVYAGWAERRDSFSDRNPIVNERGDVVLIFSGEEYPNPGTIAELAARGHQVEKEGSSYLVHVYEEDRTFPAGL